MDAVPLTNHDFSTVFRVTQALPTLFIAFAVLLITVLQKCCKKRLKSWGFGFSGHKIEVDENLPNFYNAIKLSEADWIVTEN